MANPNDIVDIIDVQATITSGGGVSIQSFSDPIFVSEFAANASFPDRTKAYTGTLTEMRAALVADGFATTSPAYRQVSAAMVQSGPPSTIYIGRIDPADATLTDALTAIWAESALEDQSLYFVCIDTRDVAEIEEASDWTQAQGFALYMSQTDDASVYNNTPGNVASNIITKGYDRTALLWHNPAVASNYGPAVLAGRTGPFALPFTSGTLQVRIDGGALQVFTIEAFAATLLGSNVEPFAFANGDAFSVAVDSGAVQLISVSLAAATVLSSNAETYNLMDSWTLLIRVDGGVSQVVTFNGTPGSVATTTGAPFTLNDLETVTFAINGGGNQVVTFNAADFVDINNATAAELNAVYSAQLTGVTVSDDGTNVTVTSNRSGAASDVEIVAGTGTALANLGYVVGNNFGTGGDTNIAFLDAATAAEVAAEINFDTVGLTAAADSGSVRLTSDTIGKSSRIQVVGGLANNAIGFNTNEFAGSGDFNDSSAVTATEVVAWMTANLYGLTISVDTGAVRLTTKSRGQLASITIAASTVATTLGLAVGTVTGSGDVGLATNASAGEIATKIAATIVGGTAGAASSAVVISSATNGPTSTVEVVGGTYASLLFSTLSATGTGTDEDYADCAFVGRCATFRLDEPNGQATWDNQPLVGIFPDKIPSNVRSLLHNTLKVNTYERRNGRNETHFGTVLYGTTVTEFRYIDQRVSADWGDARITEAFKSVLNRLADAKQKAPLTADGVELLANEFRDILKRGETNGHWVYDGSEITGIDDTGITIPTVAGQTQANLNARKITGFTARFFFQDAIQRAQAQLNLSVTIV